MNNSQGNQCAVTFLRNYKGGDTHLNSNPRWNISLLLNHNKSDLTFGLLSCNMEGVIHTSHDLPPGDKTLILIKSFESVESSISVGKVLTMQK